MTASRVISLVPSVTETLLAWGVEPVACTRFCEQPELRHVGGTKNPDVAAIDALAPDLVVMEREENRREDHDELQRRGVPVLALQVRSLGELDTAMSELADRVGQNWEPLARQYPTSPATRGAAVAIWRRPWMWLGTPTYGSALLGVLGISNVLAGRGAYPTLELDEVTAAGPDVVLAPDEPYEFGERHRAELERVAPAVLLDGKDLLWWGARTRGAIDRLRQLLSDGVGRTRR